MAEIQNQIFLENFRVLNDLKLSEDFKQNIKYLYICKGYFWNKENIFLVTNEDKVYCFGSNRRGLLGFSHENEMNGLSLNQDLSHKQIIDFKNSWYHVIARTSHGNVYCWGWNGWGRLGNGKNDYEIYKPEFNQYLSGNQIIDICCGFCHTIVLTISGEVYSWGYNYSGQIGIGSDDQCVSVPTLLNAFNGEKVKAISCGSFHSLALTESGRVFSWGSNTRKQLGVSSESLIQSNKPILIEMNEIIIEKISCGRKHNLLLSCEGDIYVFGDNSDGQLGTGGEETQITPKNLNIKEKFTDISAHYNYDISIAVSDKNVFYIWGKEILKPIETKFNSFEEIFANYFQITNKSIKIDYKNIEYNQDFQELGFISSGSFGIVCKANKTKLNKVFAVKKIPLNEEFREKSLREITIWSQLTETVLIVKFESFWTESNYYLKNGFNNNYSKDLKSDHPVFNPNYKHLLHIQMELCLNTLKEIIEKLNNELNQKLSEVMTPLGYCIASELFIEILESVDYLHKQNIIHRDLKPSNILITNGLNGRFVKLADFGLSQIHEYEDQTHTKYVGTDRYVAPEVRIGNKYDISADIFSLGLILQDMFNTDINEPIGDTSEHLKSKYSNLFKWIEKMISPKKNLRSNCDEIGDNCEHLESKYSNLFKWIEKMISPKKNLRPNCDKILKKRNSFSLSLTEFLKFKSNFENIENMKSIEGSFHQYFIQKKLKFIYKPISSPTLIDRILNFTIN